MWHEAPGGRGSDEIASCLVKQLNDLPEYIESVVIYSDSCPGQNKNTNVATALPYYVSKFPHLKRLKQKFLEPSHTRLECDLYHSKIEKAKKKIIY